jgi:hypothetical protein
MSIRIETIIDPATYLATLQPGHVMTAQDLEVLSWLKDEPWRQRKRRLDARDDAIREAARNLPPMGHTLAAQEIEKALRRYLATAAIRSYPPGDQFQEVIAQVAQLNSGKTIGWRQIDNVLKGFRDLR